MPNLKEVQPPEPYGNKVFNNKLFDRLIGFDEWVAKNKAEHYRKYNPLATKEKTNEEKIY